MKGSLRRFLVLWMVLVLRTSASTGQFWVSVAGSDTNAGTFASPFATIGKAVSLPAAVLMPGDTIIVRGGAYATNSTITISLNGTAGAPYHLLAYPGERPLLDCSGMAFNSTNRGINLKGSWWEIRGLDIVGAGDNGMYVTGSNNTIEWCTFSRNRDTGLQLSGGASYNRVINCDSYGNADPSQGNADGFAPKLTVGTGNSFYGCRAWQNSDDGWDGYLRDTNDVATTLENCWCFLNGYLSNGSPSAGNGNGFKLGGSDTKDLMHNMVLKRCVSFGNRIKGFDQNSNRGSMTLLNCTGYANGVNYALPDTLGYSRGKALTIKNCLSLGAYGTVNGTSTQATNSWMPPFALVTTADFLSVDTAGVRGPRKADGSLPDVAFLHLAPGSPLIDAGTDVGLPFAGRAPDLGAFESGMPTAVRDLRASVPAGIELLQNFPNPFNSSTSIVFAVSGVRDQETGAGHPLPVTSLVQLAVVDVLGREVALLVNGPMSAGVHSVIWDASQQPSGTYFSILRTEGTTQVKKILLVR